MKARMFKEEVESCWPTDMHNCVQYISPLTLPWISYQDNKCKISRPQGESSHVPSSMVRQWLSLSLYVCNIYISCSICSCFNSHGPIIKATKQTIYVFQYMYLILCYSHLIATYINQTNCWNSEKVVTPQNECPSLGTSYPIKIGPLFCTD